MTPPDSNMVKSRLVEHITKSVYLVGRGMDFFFFHPCIECILATFISPLPPPNSLPTLHPQQSHLPPNFKSLNNLLSPVGVAHMHLDARDHG